MNGHHRPDRKDLLVQLENYRLILDANADILADDPLLGVANVSHYRAGRYFVGAFDIPTSLSLRPVRGRVFSADRNDDIVYACAKCSSTPSKPPARA